MMGRNLASTPNRKGVYSLGVSASPRYNATPPDQNEVVTNSGSQPKPKRWTARHLGIALIAASFGLTIALAFLPSGEAWAVTIAVILVLVSGGLQFGGAFLFDKAGRADPTLARSAVGRLILLTAQANRARVRAENAFADETGARLKSSVGQLSVELSYLEEGIGASAQDWSLFHPDASDLLAEENQTHDRESK